MIPMLKNSNLKQTILIVGGIVLLPLIILYLAGYFYLWKINENPYNVTLLTFINYWTTYGYLGYVKRDLLISLVESIIPFIGLGVFLFLPKNQSLYGESRFANEHEIKSVDLYSEEGIVLGKFKEQYLMLSGQTSVICAAPPRSGKGVGLVQPNMLNWDGSVVILDIRQESWRLTSGFRQEYSDTYLFNPLSINNLTCHWNPLHYISTDPFLRINDIQKIANMLFPNIENGSDNFWMESSRSLFLGLTLYVIETPSLPLTIGEILRQIMFGEGETTGEYWGKIIKDREESQNPLSDTCMRALCDFIYTSPNTQSNIRKSFTARLEPWMNPLIDRATSNNSFDLRDLRRRRISLYIGVTPDNLSRLQIVINLLIQQIIDLNTQIMPEEDDSLKHQLLLLMDEFTAIGPIPSLAKSISFIGGFNIRMLMIIQSLSQLRATYGNDIADTFVACMGAKIIFAPKDVKAAKEISEELGYNTVKAHSYSKPQGLSLHNGSKTCSDHQRALLLPQEIKEIGKHREIILIENTKPILCHKIIYYKDSCFKERLMKTAAVNVESFVSKSPLQPITQRKSRPLKPDDIESIDKLNLSDFAYQFEEIEIPKGNPLTDEEMKGVVDQLLTTLTQP